jgi:hypothetical protein
MMLAIKQTSQIAAKPAVVAACITVAKFRMKVQFWWILLTLFVHL